MPRDRVRPAVNEKSTGLLSSVFTFVSREIDSFVSNATGRPSPEDEDEVEDDEEEAEEEDDERPQASSSRMQLPQRKRKYEEKVNGVKTGHRDRERTFDADRSNPSIDSSTLRARSRSRRREDAASDSDEADRRKARRVTSSPLNTPRPARRRPAPTDEDEEELVDSNKSPTSSPESPPRFSRRKRSHFTMPGALYDRTSSLEPTPEPDGGRTRHVRFASGVPSSPESPRMLAKTPRSVGRNNDAKATSSGRKSPFNRQARNASDGESSSEDEEGIPSSPIKRTPRPRRNSFVQEAIRQRSAEKNPNTSLLLPKSPVSAVYSSPTKGKGKEKAFPPDVINIEDSDENSSSNEEYGRSNEANLSVRTRVKGKERELHSAKQREREREDDEERRRDKEKIRVLEEELRKLREELARRPVAPQPYSVPPPPPPPPPPRPPVTSRSQTSRPASTFADVRASLRHAGMPVEKPINPAAYGGPSVRKGQPTINLGADMMAAFLTELKTHRLRRVCLPDGEGTTTPASRSQPAMRAREVGDVGNRSEFMIRPREIDDVGNRSEIVPRPNRNFAIPTPAANGKMASVRTRHATIPSEDRARAGEKRKYTETSNDAPQESMPSKRRALISPSQFVDTSVESLSGHSTVPTRNSKLPMPSGPTNQPNSVAGLAHSRPLRTASDTSLNSRMSSGTRAETDITTPSLSSDNEQENGSNESQERLPTPPEASASFSVQDKKADSTAVSVEEVLDVHDADDEQDADEMYQPVRQQDKSRFRTRSLQSPEMAERFARRAPASPRLLDSPRRPRPPARPRIIKEVTQPEGPAVVEEPSFMSYASADAPSFCQAEESRVEQEQQTSMNAQETPPRHFPIRPPKGTFKPPKQKTLPSRLPVRKGSQKSKGQKTSTRGSANTSVPVSKPTRRESLDAELRRAEAEAEAAYEADILDDDVQLESGTFTGRGMRSRKHGFLAFGGAGGPPTVMGEGSVAGLENFEESGDERQEIIRSTDRGARRIELTRL